MHRVLCVAVPLPASSVLFCCKFIRGSAWRSGCHWYDDKLGIVARPRPASPSVPVHRFTLTPPSSPPNPHPSWHTTPTNATFGAGTLALPADGELAPPVLTVAAALLYELSARRQGEPDGTCAAGAQPFAGDGFVCKSPACSKSKVPA